MLAAGVFGDREARTRALDLIHRYLDMHPPAVSGVIVYSLIRMGEPARALAVVQRGRTTNDAVFLSLIWSPYGQGLRRLPEFPAFAREMGFADVWDKYGPPENCDRASPGEYVCR